MSSKVVRISDADDTERRKIEDRVFILEQFIEKVEAGEVVEFVISAAGPDGSVEVSMYSQDFLGAVGMFEVGKHIIMGAEMHNHDDDDEE